MINFNQSSCVNSLQDELVDHRKLLSWDHENYIFPKVTKMGSIFGHRIDYNGVAKFNPSNPPGFNAVVKSSLSYGNTVPTAKNGAN